MFLKKKIYPFFEKGVFKNTRLENNPQHIINSIFIYFQILKMKIKEWNSFSVEKYSSEVAKLTNKNINVSLIESKNPIIIPMGHATNLIKLKNYTIITDPIFWAPSFFFNRYVPCIPDPINLPPIDAILLSHNHRDHVDYKSLSFLLKKNKKISVHAPLGMKKYLKDIGFKNIIEYAWWQSEEIIIKNHIYKMKIKISFLPALHWAQRSFFDYNKSLWGSFMIELFSNAAYYSIYFAGDSAYSPHFKTINDFFPTIDCALIPIAPLEPSENITNTHMTIEESIKAINDLNALSVIPIHWGVFRFGLESLETPINLLKKALKEKNMLFLLKTEKIGDICFIKKEFPKKDIIATISNPLYK